MHFSLWQYRLKPFFALLLSCAILLSACLGFRFVYAMKLSALQGERTFYLYHSSSNALQKEKLSFLDVFYVQGESVCFAIENSARQTVEEIFAKYNGVAYMQEDAGGTVSVYGFAPGLYNGVIIDGKNINLHVAVKDGRCVVGSPIIFGGF